MSARAAIIGAILWCGVIISTALTWNRGPHPDPVPAPTAIPDQPDDVESEQDSDEDSSASSTITLSMSAPEVPEFTLTECQGGEFGLSDLKGRPWVASFIFTRCVMTCPQITLAMKKLHDRVKDDNPDVMFVTLTVDSEYDTVEIMERYSETFEPDRTRWKFLTGDMDAMHALIVDGFGVFVKENIGEARRPGMEIAHSNRVVLVNSDGAPVGKYLGTKDEEMAELAQILTGRKPFPVSGPPIQFLRPGDGPTGVEVEIVPLDSERSDPEALSLPDNSETDASTSEMSPAARVARIQRLLPRWAGRLPTVNAVLNSTSILLLTAGWIAIRRGNKSIHRNLMLAAFVMSVGFLTCYLISHWALGSYTGERGRPFLGQGASVILYRFILWPHIALAAAVPFLAIRVFQHAFAERWEQHRRLARRTFPIWMYVSITGVVIYGMLYHWPASR
jgi:protein SCO1